MKVFISEDEFYPFYNIIDDHHGIEVTMTSKKYARCMKVLKEFDEVLVYLKKRYLKQEKRNAKS